MKKAVIVAGGKQYLVSEKETLKVDLVGDQKQVTFEPLLVIDGDTVNVGQPSISGVSVKANVVESSVKGEKVTAIRFKAKKRVNKKRGHRQQHSVIEITKIG